MSAANPSPIQGDNALGILRQDQGFQPRRLCCAQYQNLLVCQVHLLEEQVVHRRDFRRLGLCVLET